MVLSDENSTATDLHRVTVVVPTYSRPASVRRQVEYWGNRGPSLVILDGSDHAMDAEFVSSLPANVRYVHSLTSFNHRRMIAAEYIQTEFAILLPDDEFHLESGLRDCIQYLDRNPDVIGCGGKVLGFFVEQGEFRAFHGYDDWLRFPDSCRTIRDRLDFALPPRKAHKVECSLFRSDAWKQIFTESYSHQYSCGFTYERLLNLYAAVLGRTELLDSVLWMRSLENPPTHSVDAPRLDRNNFIAWATSGEFQNEVDHYFAKAQRILRTSSELGENEIDEYARRFLFGGIQRQMDKEARSQRGLKKKIGKLAVAYGPKFIKRAAKKILPSRFLRFTGWRGDRIDTVIELLQSSGIHCSRSDLERVAQLALASARAR